MNTRGESQTQGRPTISAIAAVAGAAQARPTAEGRAPHDGAAVRTALPSRDAGARHTSLPDEDAEDGGDRAGAGRAVTILVADDDPGIRQVLEFVFTEEGFEVCVAPTAAEARRVSADLSAGVVVVDLKLGRDDGLALARELSRQPHLAVVMVSAEPSLVQRAAETGISPDAVLTKPFQLSALVNLVRRKAEELGARRGSPPCPGGNAP